MSSDIETILLRCCVFVGFLDIRKQAAVVIFSIICINVDNDERLLLDHNKGLGINSFSIYFPLLFLKKRFGFGFLILLLYNLKDIFSCFCINYDIDVMWLLEKDKGLELFLVIFLYSS